MAVSFNNIPSNIRVPLFYAEVDNSAAGSFQVNYRALVIGQKLAAGTATADEPVIVPGSDAAKTLFGQGSHLDRMVSSWRANDVFTELWAIPVVDDGSGTAAAGVLAFTGPASSNGTLYIYIAGQRVAVGVASGDIATAIATAVAAAVNTKADLPVTAAVDGVDLFKVNLTARNKGTLGNGIDVRMNYRGSVSGESTPAGVGVTITAMVDGATDPDLGDAIAAMGDMQFDYIVLPYSDGTNLDLFKTLMNDATGRWSYAKQLYGHVFTAKKGTFSALDSFGSGRNDQHVTAFGYAAGSPTPVYEAASMFAAQAGSHLSIDPARPLQTLPLLGFLPPPKSGEFTLTENNTLLYSGIATVYYEGGYARIQRAVTTYQLNEWGQADPSYLDVETLATLSYVLRFLKSRITQKFPRHKLANDGTRFGAGQAIATPSTIRAELIAAYSEMESNGIVENMTAFKANLIVERNADDPSRVDVVYPPDLVNGLRIFALLNQFRLQYAS